MKTLQIRKTVIGEGIPAIGIPIVEVTKEEIMEAARQVTGYSPDLVEWRADWYPCVQDPECVADILRGLRDILGDIPLLFTLRTTREGGRGETNKEEYADLLIRVAQSGYADLIDVEMFRLEESETRKLLLAIHDCDCPVIGSNHDFDDTPKEEEIIRRLRKMQDMQADLVKIAVMPHGISDVVTLIGATAKMNEQYADRPVITMSMGEQGLLSRLCGESFGSAVTFGSAGKTSAPGQIPADELRAALQWLHERKQKK